MWLIPSCVISCLDGSSKSTCGPVHHSHGTSDSVEAHVSTLHAAIAAHMQDPFSEFYDVMACTRRLLWPLPLIA